LKLKKKSSHPEEIYKDYGGEKNFEKKLLKEI